MYENYSGVMVYIAAGKNGRWWFGIAWESESFVATATGSSKKRALSALRHCIPNGVAFTATEKPDDFFHNALQMLGRLEGGDETEKRFVLSTYRSRQMRRILTAAAMIPIGYVSTYGDIARAAESEARAVGRAMATNPLYPIVPCHRVVGADMSLVGYGGKQNDEALSSKLARLQAEIRGMRDTVEITLPDGLLTVYPVERVIEADRNRRNKLSRKLREQQAQEAADRLQRRLF